MNRKTYNDMVGREQQSLFELNARKGADYAGDDDVCANFKHHAELLGLTPEQIWAVYAGKHWDAIVTYCREGQVESEPIDGRIRDVIVYCFLLLAMVRDREASDSSFLSHVKRAGSGPGGPDC